MINPFNPGAGRMPPFLAGRASIVRSLKADMRQVYDHSEGARPVIISGLRGMGKTVLLQELAEEARNRGWIVVWAEAAKNDSLARKLARATFVELRRLRAILDPSRSAFSHALAVLRSFQIKVDPTGSFSLGVDVKPASGYADSGDLSLDLGDLLQALGEAAREAGTAVFVGIDELQEAAPDDLSALNVALHALGQGVDPVPVYFAGVGLPTLPAALAEATSYAERMYRYYSLDLLSEDEVRDAYVVPLNDIGVTWKDSALERAKKAAAGYPYFIQQCGYCICGQLGLPGEIGDDEVIAGIALAEDELDRGLYRSRWDRATPQSKAMMSVMAKLGCPVRLNEVALAMGKRRTSDLSPLRDRLIEDGLIYSPERGYVSFTVPGMDRFIAGVEG